MSAQLSVLKDAERAVKDGKKPADVVAVITPAFTDAETAQLAQTYVIPGKAMFAEYDELFALKSFNKLPDGGEQTMGNDLLEGYKYYMKALPLDSVADAKGKIKTKYSKDIINTIAGHLTDYNTAAVSFWELKNYDGAYRAWDIYLSIVSNPTLAAKASNVPNDTIIGEIYFNQALAAWQTDSLANALKSFSKAKAKGYHKKQLYDYAIAVASQMNNEDLVYELAQEAQPMYGAEDSNYLGFIINHYLQAKDFDKAFATIDQAIAADPSNAQYYLVKGILYDNQDKKEDAKAMFKKAVDLNGENSQALYNYGRSLCEEAYTLSDNAPTNYAESEKYYNEKIAPLFKEASGYLERAWDIDNNNTDALRYLENVYYNLHDETNLKDVKQRLGE
jgi:tetratricopeptide (TPR) repeat protein